MKKIIVCLFAFMLILGTLAGCAQPAVLSTEDPADKPEGSGEEAGAPAGTEESGYLQINWDYLNSTQSGFQSPELKGNYLETNFLWSNLLEVDVETGEIVYDLAESMDISEDGLTYTFKLRDNAYWTDGEPVTAQDVVFTYNAAIYGPTPNGASYISAIKGFNDAFEGKTDSLAGVYAVDDKTVVFELDSVNYLCLTASSSNFFANGFLAIIPYHILGELPWSDIESDPYWNQPIGCGPYVIKEVSYPNYYVLERNENYYREAPGIEKILVTSYTDGEAQSSAAMADKLDIIRNINSADAENISAQNADCSFFLHDSNFNRCFGFCMLENAQNKDMLKKEVRQAFNLIIDKQAIADYVVTASAATNFNNDLEYNSDIPEWTRNVEKGVEMLNAAGFDFSKTVKMLAYYTDQATVDILDIVVANFAEAGITAEYTIDGATPNEQFATGAFDMMFQGTGYGTQVYSFVAPNGLNESQFAGYDSDYRKVYDELWVKYCTTPDAAGRKLVSGELQILFQEDMYLIPTYFLNTGYLINTGNLQGYTGISADYELIAAYRFDQWSLAK